MAVPPRETVIGGNLVTKPTGFKGRILVYHNPKTLTLEVIADNRGESPGVFTHCMFAREQDAKGDAYVGGRWVSHDDGNFGHHNTVQAGRPYVLRFPIGTDYLRGNGGVSGVVETVRIEPGIWVRVGFRHRAWEILQLPPAGEAVEIGYERLRPNNEGYASGRALGWPTTPLSAEEADIAPDEIVRGVLRVLGGVESRHVVKGRASILPVAKKDAPDDLEGWEVRFDNSGDSVLRPDQTSGFIGTVLLSNAEGRGEKNAGLGLESMACPEAGCSAVQFIQAHGDYGHAQFGVVAEPGTMVRLGVRGWSHLETRLPSLGENVTVSLDAFVRESEKTTPEWFETKDLTAKLGEKKGSVQFYRGGELINDTLPDTIYTGEDALTRAEFKPPPRVIVERSGETPEMVRVRIVNDLPAADALGPIAFVAALRLISADDADNANNADNKAAPSLIARFDADTRTHDLTLEAVAGSRLEIDTGPLGWRGSVEVPEHGIVDTHATEVAMLSRWVLRETDYKRAGLTPGAADARSRSLEDLRRKE